MEKVYFENCIAIDNKKICIYLLACKDIQYRYYIPKGSNSNGSFYFSPTIKVMQKTVKYLSGHGDVFAISRIRSATTAYNQIKKIVDDRFNFDDIVICAIDLSP